MKLKVVTYNVFAPVAEPIRHNSQNARMHRIPGALAYEFPDADVVVVQESIIPAQHAILSRGMKKHGYSYETEPITSSRTLVHGGVIVFSKHPIKVQEQHVFDGPCEGSDCMAAKGFVYALIDKFGVPFHLVGIHLQAWPTEASRTVRRSQIGNLKDFIDAKGFPATEPLIVAGDFNVDRYSERNHLKELFGEIDADYPDISPDSHMFTSDPATNALMGNDETMAYASEEYPNGCYTEYLETMSCPCAPREWLDYVLLSKKHLQPTSQSLTCVAMKTETFDAQMNLKTWRRIEDLSDHYPVCADLEFDLQPLRMPDIQENTYGMSFSALLTGGIFFVLILLVITGIALHLLLD